MILVDTKYRTPISENTKGIYLVDIPAAAEKIAALLAVPKDEKVVVRLVDNVKPSWYCAIEDLGKHMGIDAVCVKLDGSKDSAIVIFGNPDKDLLLEFGIALGVHIAARVHEELVNRR